MQNKWQRKDYVIGSDITDGKNREWADDAADWWTASL